MPVPPLNPQDASSYRESVEKQLQVLQSLNMITEYLQRENGELAPELDPLRSLINLRLDRQQGAVVSEGGKSL